MKGKVKQMIIDWLSFTVETPVRDISRKLPDGSTETAELYLGRSPSGHISERDNYIPIALAAALPPSLSQPTHATNGVTISSRDYGKHHMKNYDNVYPLTTIDGETVGVIGWHRTNVKMGIHVDMSGSHLETLREMGFDTQELIKQIIFMQNAKITRIDFAIDIETLETPKNLYKQVEKHKIRSEYKGLHGSILERKTNYIENDMGKEGSGIYFGSKSSDRFCRIYDKGKQRLLGEDLLRIEFVARNEQSQEWARFAALHDIPTAATSFYRSFLSGWSAADRWLSKFPGSLTSSIPRVDRPGSDRWLRTVATPAVVKALSQKTKYAAELRAHLCEVLFGLDVAPAYERPKAKPLDGKVWSGVGDMPVKPGLSESFRFSQETIDKYFIRTVDGLKMRQNPL